MKKCPNCGAVAAEETMHCEVCGQSFYVHAVSTRPPPSGDNSARTRKWQRVLFVLVALGLIITFVRRLFPIEEMPQRSVVVLTILIDLALAIALVGFGTRILKTIPKGTSGRGGWLLLFVAGLISVLGISVIHLNDGQRVEWQSRSQSETKALPADLKEMTLLMEDLSASFKKAQAEEANTRWVQVSNEAPGDMKKLLSREDWQDYVAKQRTVIDSIDRLLKFLTRPNLAADFNRVYDFAESRGLTGGKKRPNIDPQSWRLLRQQYVAESNCNQLMVEHWDDWHSTESPPPNAEPQPWQKEADRLTDEAREADKQLKELTTRAASKPTPQGR